MYTEDDVLSLEKNWKTDPRWKGILRSYSAQDVIQLRGSISIDHSIARQSSQKLWELFQKERFVPTLGVLTGNQALQIVQAGLKAIYASGWQVAADANDAFQVYPDQSLYPNLSMPHLIRKINNALLRADQIQHMKNLHEIDWLTPIIADAEAGFGGPLNVFELTKAMIEAGVAGIHLEDQVSSLKKCGHMGGKVLVPGKIFIENLMAMRLASDVLGVPILIIARTDSLSAKLIRSDFDELDKPFLTGERCDEGFYYLKGGLEYAIQRGLDFAPYSDMLWCETAKPDLGEAREFAQGIHEKYPGKWLAYNCSPSFNWKSQLDEKTIASFQEKLGEMGYKFQFVTLAGFHTLNASIFALAHQYSSLGMSAYANFQQEEFRLEKEQGFTAVKHQQFVGAGYFDKITTALSRGLSSTTSLNGSTEESQF